MRPFSFVHAADLHIDSPFKGVTAQVPAIAEALRKSTLRAFDNLVETALERQVDFLVAAGDVYDSQDRSLRAQLHLREGLDRLGRAGIRSFVVHGNHDPLDSLRAPLAWPPQAHFFGSKVEYLTVESARASPGRSAGEPLAVVAGISFPKRDETRNLATRFKRQPADLFQIGVLHCNVGGDPAHDNYAPCQLGDLTAVGLDYWALGHVHTRRVLSENPWVVYPGNVQGRSIREQGPRGCYHVQVDDRRRVTTEFIPLDVIRWSEARVSITDIESMDALEQALTAQVEALSEEAAGRGLICHLSIAGRGPLHAALRRPHATGELLERLRERFQAEDPFVWVQTLSTETRPEVDLDERAKRGDLLAEVLTMARESREDASGPAAPSAVCAGPLAALRRDRRVRKALPPELTGEEARRLLAEAEMLCLDLLEEGA